MDKREARVIAAQHIARLEKLGYSALLSRIDQVDEMEAKSETGNTYHLQYQFFWDDKPNGAIRVFVNIDDGGLRAFMPLSESTIVEPPK